MVSYIRQAVARQKRYSRMLSPLLLFAVIAFSSAANADLILNVAGSPGSADLTLSMSGSLTYTDVNTSINTSTQFMRAPTAFGSWFTPTSNWQGDQLWTVGFAQTNFVANSSDLKLSISGDHTQEYTFDGINISSSNDGWLIPWNSAIQGTYPALSLADITITVSGSAAFTLPGGLTFDDLDLGTRTSGFSYPDDVVQTVSEASIPEPATLALLGLGVAGIGYQRRKRLKG